MKYFYERFLEKKVMTVLPLDVAIRACALGGNLAMAYEIFGNVHKFGLENAHSTYTYLLESCAILQHGKYARQIFTDMRTRDMPIEPITLHFLIRANTTPKSSSQDAVRAMDNAICSGVTITLRTFALFIRFLCSKGDRAIANEYLPIAEYQYIHPRYLLEDILENAPQQIDEKHQTHLDNIPFQEDIN